MPALSRRHCLLGDEEENTRSTEPATATAPRPPLFAMRALQAGLFLLIFASTATARMMSLAPVIRLPVGVGDHLVVEDGHDLRIVCEGMEPLQWSYPHVNSDPPLIIKSDTDYEELSRSIFHRPIARRHHTGLYECTRDVYGDFIYVYVKSLKNPWVVNKVLVLLENQGDVKIDCRPNIPRTRVRLMHENGSEIPLGYNAEDGTTLSWREREGFVWSNVSTKRAGRYYCEAELPEADRPLPRLPVFLMLAGLSLHPEGEKEIEETEDLLEMEHSKKTMEIEQNIDITKPEQMEEMTLTKKMLKVTQQEKEEDIIEKKQVEEIIEKEEMEDMLEKEEMEDIMEMERLKEMVKMEEIEHMKKMVEMEEMEYMDDMEETYDMDGTEDMNGSEDMEEMEDLQEEEDMKGTEVMEEREMNQQLHHIIPEKGLNIATSTYVMSSPLIMVHNIVCIVTCILRL